MDVAHSRIEYLPSPDIDLTVLAARLPARLRAGAESTEQMQRSFYDTFDGRLARRSLALSHEDGCFKLRDADGHELAVQASEPEPDALIPADLPPGPLREAIAPACGVRVLLRGPRIDTTRSALPVLDDDEQTVARIAYEHGALADGAQAGEPLHPRLSLIGVRGHGAQRRRLRKLIEHELGMGTSTETLAQEAAARAGTAPPALPAAAQAELTPDLPADRAAVVLSTRLLSAIEANLPGTIAGLDSEFLHDLRVAVRRTRSLLRELKTVFPADELRHFRTEFKWVQQATGASRDLDVYLLEFADFTAAVPDGHQAALQVLHAVLEDRQATERIEMERALQSARMTALLRDWAAFLERLPSAPVDGRPDAVTPIVELAARRIKRVYRQMVKMGSSISGDSPHSDLHELRKKGKELRYLLEFFAPLFPGKVTKPMVKSLKALQDTLGRFQDREVQTDMIRGLTPDVAERPGAAEAIAAMELLVGRLEEEQQDARAEFHDRFAAFASRKQRALVAKTFR